MALETACSLLGGIMKMVFPGAIFTGHMASVAEGIPIHKYFTAMRFMTILANDPGLMHFTLKKGGVNIDLILYLSVREIEILVKQGGPVGIQ